MYTFRLIASIVLGLFSLVACVGNWMIVLHNVRHRSTISLVPAAGTVCGIIAVLVCPAESMAIWIGIPGLLDSSLLLFASVPRRPSS